MSDPTFVTAGPWGSGTGAFISANTVDYNFWYITLRVRDLEDNPPAAISIAYFEVSGAKFYVHLTDHSILGPYDLPFFVTRWRGTWAPLTPYYVLDRFTIGGAVYDVIYDHTSEASFDAGANDGLGHDYYQQNLGPLTLAIDDLTDVDLDSLTTGQYLRYEVDSSGSTWRNVDAPTLATLPDVDLTSPVNGHYLRYVVDSSGSSWRNVAVGFPALVDLTDVEFTSLASGDLIQYLSDSDGDRFVNVAPSVVDFDFAPEQLRSPTVTALANSGGVSIDPTLGDVFTVIPSGPITLSASSAPGGAHITLIVTTSGTSSYDITPGASLIAAGILATGTVDAKTFTISFVGNGSDLVETGRTVAM